LVEAEANWKTDDRRTKPGFYFVCMVHEGLNASVKARS
jgi:hypothetical protein